MVRLSPAPAAGVMLAALSDRLLAVPATMVKPFVVVPETVWVLTVAPAKVIVGVPALVSE